MPVSIIEMVLVKVASVNIQHRPEQYRTTKAAKNEMFCIQGLILWSKTTERQLRLLSKEPNHRVKGFSEETKVQSFSFNPKAPAKCCNQLRSQHRLLSASDSHFLSIQLLPTAQVQKGRAEQTSARRLASSLLWRVDSSQSKGRPAHFSSTSIKQKSC